MSFKVAIFCGHLFAVAASCLWAGDGMDVTRPLGRMDEPFATGLDFDTFNPAEGEKSDQILGEILSLFDEFLVAQGISGEWTPENLEKLKDLIQRDYDLASSREDSLDDRYDVLKDQLDELEEDLEDGKNSADVGTYLSLKKQASPIKKKRDLLRDYLDLEKPLLRRLDAALENPGNGRLREEACRNAVQVLYSLFSSQYMDGQPPGPEPLDMRDKRQLVRHFVDRGTLNAVPYWKTPYRMKLWMHRAKKEAANLINPDSPDRFVSPREMAKMTHSEVAALDVSPDNPMWHTRAFMERECPDTWSMIEGWLSREVTGEMLDSKKFRKKFPDFSYSLNSARRVLFFDKIKVSATSPKIDVVDAFGQDWKLKWGEESIVEPITNRLRLKLGQKFADLTYADVDGNSHLLILSSRLQKEMNPKDVMPLGVDEFVTAMKESKYDFNIRPFILSSGKITEDNAVHVLSGLPKEAKKKYRAGNLVGRTWIKFRESMVEAKHDVFVRGGPVSTNTTFAYDCRAMRQSMIFSFWMDDTDVKEDNYSSAWMKDFAGRSGWQYFQWFHDPGSSIGGGRRTGEVNMLDVKTGTGNFAWYNPDGSILHSNAFQLYRPGAWDHVTYADHFAGAEHLVRLRKEDIREAVRHSKMPDFYQACMVWRLTKRRDILARYLDLRLPDGGAGDPPQVSVPLTTRSDRATAARRYRIPLFEIENDLIRTAYLSKENPAADTVAPFRDEIVKDGVIQHYHDTVIPGILRDVRHPAGFVERMTRFDDGGEWVSMRFQKK